MDSTVRRIACTVQYEGTAYSGWQLQNDDRTVQGEIEKALEILTKEKIRITASGRTDAGVHALGQVFHFDTSHDVSLKKICSGLNGILSRDVSIQNAFNVHNKFHARYDAVEREYRYYIYNHRQTSPFALNRTYWVRETLDLEYLKEVCQRLIGEKDFASFCKKRESQDINTVRVLKEISIEKFNNIIEITFKGNAFLHNMIRIIVGTLIEMHHQKDSPARIDEIIKKKDRDWGGPTAPPIGLYLYRVTYSPRLRTYPAAYDSLQQN